MSVDAVSDVAKRSLAFEFFNSGAIAGSAGDNEEDCVDDVVVEFALTLATAVDTWQLHRLFVLSRRFFSSAVRYKGFDKRNPYYKLIKDIG